MSTDFFEQLLDMSRQATAKLLEQLEDARQNRLSDLTTERESFVSQRTDIESQINELQKQHGEFSAELDRVAREISQVETFDIRSGMMNMETAPMPAPKQAAASSPVKSHGTPSGQLTLRETVLQVLKASKKALSVAEITNEIIESGFQSTSKDLKAMVQKVVYELKKVGKVKPTKTKGLFTA